MPSFDQDRPGAGLELYFSEAGGGSYWPRAFVEGFQMPRAQELRVEAASVL